MLAIRIDLIGIDHVVLSIISHSPQQKRSSQPNEVSGSRRRPGQSMMSLKMANQTVKARSRPAISKSVKRLAEESHKSPGKHDENTNENFNVAKVTSPLKKLKLKLSPGKNSEVSTASDQSQHDDDISGTSKSVFYNDLVYRILILLAQPQFHHPTP